MRVLACCDYYHPRSPGGAERVAAEIYRRVVRSGDVEVRVVGAVPPRMVAGGPGDPPGVDDDPSGLTVDRVRGYDLTGVLGAQLMVAPGHGGRFRHHLAQFRPDVVHVNGLHFHSTIAGLRAARRAGVPTVATAHLADVSAMPGRAAAASAFFDRHVGGWAARSSDAVVAVSRSVRSHLLDLGVAPDHITVVPNGVDHDRFHAEGRVPPGSELRVAFIGRLVANKGPLEALDAVAMARMAGHRIRLDVYGDGPLDGEVRRRAAQADLSGHVHLHGFVDDVETRLRATDVLLRPSYSEGLPLAVLEAMASGVVVVGTDVGGNVEAIIGASEGTAPHGDAGLVVPIGDTEAVARAIGRLDSSRDELAALGQAALGRAATFGWDRAADGHRVAWEAAAETARRGAAP